MEKENLIGKPFKSQHAKLNQRRRKIIAEIRDDIGNQWISYYTLSDMINAEIDEGDWRTSRRKGASLNTREIASLLRSFDTNKRRIPLFDQPNSHIIEFQFAQSLTGGEE